MTPSLKVNDDKKNQKWKLNKNKDQCQCAENSIPTKEFKITEINQKTGKQSTRIIKEISVMRGKDGDCIGWSF